MERAFQYLGLDKFTIPYNKVFVNSGVRWSREKWLEFAPIFRWISHFNIYDEYCNIQYLFVQAQSYHNLITLLFFPCLSNSSLITSNNTLAPRSRAPSAWNPKDNSPRQRPGMSRRTTTPRRPKRPLKRIQWWTKKLPATILCQLPKTLTENSQIRSHITFAISQSVAK